MLLDLSVTSLVLITDFIRTDTDSFAFLRALGNGHGGTRHSHAAVTPFYKLKRQCVHYDGMMSPRYSSNAFFSANITMYKPKFCVTQVKQCSSLAVLTHVLKHCRGLTSLQFDDKFNDSLPRNTSWPRSLQTLELGLYFRQPLEAQLLPPTLTTLGLGGFMSNLEFGSAPPCKFNQAIPRNWLPITLTELSLLGNFRNQPFDFLTPLVNLQTLHLGLPADFPGLPLENLPTSLQTIQFIRPIGWAYRGSDHKDLPPSMSCPIGFQPSLYESAWKSTYSFVRIQPLSEEATSDSKQPQQPQQPQPQQPQQPQPQQPQQPQHPPNSLDDEEQKDTIDEPQAKRRRLK